MGLYWRCVTLDKKEFIDPYTLDSGAKLGEQLGTYPGVGSALIILCAAMPEVRGGGDLDLDENWHGPERSGGPPGPMPDDYPAIAHSTIGRWAGDRIALVGCCPSSDTQSQFRTSAWNCGSPAGDAGTTSQKSRRRAGP